MKKRGILLAAFIWGFMGAGFVLLETPRAQAAACANVSSFGAVTMQLPDLTNVQDQSLWVRMQGQVGDSVLVELNSSECMELKLQNDSTDTWSWQSLKDISFPETAGNQLKIIGVSSGVRVDRVLVTDQECTPEDFGNNCRSSVALTVEDEVTYTALSSPAGPVSGKVHLSPTVQNSGSELTALSYMVGGRVLQRETSPQPFDTSLVENGKHTVYITTTLEGGEEVREMVPIEVQNPENALSPIARWMKRNQTALTIGGIGLLAVAVLLIVLKFIFGWRRSRRERTFRGL